jgi:hypothetical protein
MIRPTDSELRLGFGYLTITYLFVLALIVALGDVEESKSFGLHDIIQGFLLFAAAYCGWAFRAEVEAAKLKTSPNPATAAGESQ